MNIDQIITVVTWLLAAEPASAAFPVIAAGGADLRYPVAIEACPRPLPAGEVEGKTVICGRVDVPENHGKPEGRRIKLAFAVLKARTQSPAPDPLIYLHGGPGGGAVRDLAGIVVPLWDNYRARRDVVTFDQRAAGISSDMVTCFANFGAHIYEMFHPEKLAGEAGNKFFADCVAELKADGRDLTAYNTPQNARDVQALMRALGYSTYNIYGVSYGTKLALEVMRTAPEGVRAVVIDSVFPPEERGYDLNIIPVQEGVQAVLDQCAADAACAKAYPKLEETLLRVAEKLKLNPIPAGRGQPEITVKTLIALFEDRNTFGHWPGATAYIPLILTEWDRGETKTWDLLASGATTRLPTTAERLKPYRDKLTAEQNALATLILESASARRSEDSALAASLQALSDSLARSSSGATDLARRFDETITQAMIRTNSREEMLRFAVNYAGLASRMPDRAVLRDLVIDHLPAADIDPALALLDQLTEGDIKAVFAAVSNETRAAYAPLLLVFDLMVIACQEDLPYNSLEGMQKAVAGLKFPFLAQSTYVDRSAYDMCQHIPPAPSSPNYHDPVTSDLPALVLYGLNDTQTSSAAAKQAAAALRNSRAYGFPEAGHGALIFSQCAKDIGMAFIERPGDPLSTDCIETLKPKWVLPQ